VTKYTLLDDAAPTAPKAETSAAPKYTLIDDGYSPTYGALQAFLQGVSLGFGDEIAAGVKSAVSDKTYREALDEERTHLKKFKKKNPVTGVALEVGGGFATPGLGLLSGILRPAATVLGNIGKGAAVGTGLGAVAGAGTAEGNENIPSAMAQGAVGGAVVGGALPVAAGVAAPVIGKALDTVRPMIARKRGGAGDAADEIMTQWMRSGGDNPAALQKKIDDATEAGRLYSNSSAVDATMLADVSPSMQKLAGAATRSSPEAAAQASTVIKARQTGVAPIGDAEQAIADAAGLVTRNPLAKRVKGEKPAGQFERVGDAFKRALTIHDKDFHKMGENAYQTEKSMMAALKVEADKLYGEARKASENFNVAPVVQPVIQKWAGEIDMLPIGEAGLVRKALRQFTMGNGNVVTSLDAFDKGKRAVDGLIGRARTAGDNNAVRVLTGIKDEMVSAVDSVGTQDIGRKYAAARDYYSSQMDLMDALELGRKAFRDNPEALVDQFRAMSTGQQKMFRLGVLESFKKEAGGKKRSADVVQMFETPRMQDLLREVIPRSGGKVYATRPERFGDYLQNEKAMIGTRDAVTGNSQTQPRAMDDALFARQTASEIFDRVRSQPSLLSWGLELGSAAMNKVFGFREDVAAELARRLFTANPQERERILTALQQRMGQSRFDEWVNTLNTAAQQIGSAGAIAAGGAIGSTHRERKPAN